VSPSVIAAQLGLSMPANNQRLSRHDLLAT
jgi:hypothetical protein